MINILKLHLELQAAGFPVCSVRDVDPLTCGQPVADYTRPLGAVEQDAAAAVIAAHNPDTDPLPASEKEQISALSNQVDNLQAALDLVTSRMVSGKLMTAAEVQSLAQPVSGEAANVSKPIQTVT